MENLLICGYSVYQPNKTWCIRGITFEAYFNVNLFQIIFDSVSQKLYATENYIILLAKFPV